MSMRKKAIKQPSSYLSPSSQFVVLTAVPSDDHVVSKYADGRVASRYGDIRWDWTPYIGTGKSRFLNFCYWDDPQELTPQRIGLVAEARWLLYSIISRGGYRYSYSTLNLRVMTLRKLAAHCEKSCMQLRELLSDHMKLLKFVSQLEGYVVKHLIDMCQLWAKVGGDVTGFSLPGSKTIDVIKAIGDRYANSNKQHPPLPSRIYSNLLSNFSGELSDFEAISQRYLALARECCLNPALGRVRTNQTRKSSAEEQHLPYLKTMPVLLEEYGLKEYFHAKGLDANLKGFSRGLSRIMMIMRLTIQAYTGMRDGEVSKLTYGCLDEYRVRDRTHFVISGVTTKFNGGRPQKTNWVTGVEGAKAVELARLITKLNFELFNRNRGKVLVTLKSVPLFSSVAYFRFVGAGPARGDKERMLAGQWVLSGYRELREFLQPKITEDDLRELEEIDPHRAWRSEGIFIVGKSWTFTSHQLRRSLALYAQRSGLVSLTSLKRQLQHITTRMSRYYAKGSAFARDFIGADKQHFAYEWQDTQALSSALSFIKHAIRTDDVLFGGHGNWIENRLRDIDGQIELNREATIKRFVKGEIAYRDTNLGGCTKVGPCDKRPIRWHNIDCLKGCASLVGQLKKLERVVIHQTKLVASLSPTSSAFQSEKADLDTLVNVLNKVRKQSKVKNER